MRRFVLVRDVDITGISGEGVVVWGIQYPDGICAYRWNSPHKTTCVADSISDIETIHGHNGATRVVWLDDDDASSGWRAMVADVETEATTFAKGGIVDRPPAGSDQVLYHPGHESVLNVGSAG